MNLYLFCYKKPDRFYSLCKIHLLLFNVVLTSCNTVDTFSIFPKSSLLDLPLPKMPSILSALSGLFEKEFALILWNVPLAGLTLYGKQIYYFNLLLRFIVTYFLGFHSYCKLKIRFGEIIFKDIFTTDIADGRAYNLQIFRFSDLVSQLL